FALSGALDPALLAASLSEIVRRHEALRTTFVETAPGEPGQVVDAYSAVETPLVDLTGVPDAAAEAGRLLAAAGRRPFDLATGPLLRSLLVRLGAERHHLLLTVHHIVADG